MGGLLDLQQLTSRSCHLDGSDRKCTETGTKGRPIVVFLMFRVTIQRLQNYIRSLLIADADADADA